VEEGGKRLLPAQDCDRGEWGGEEKTKKGTNEKKNFSLQSLKGGGQTVEKRRRGVGARR